ncbi:MAG: 4Fe-4S binding protein [Elusimicrobia bacterium]|nr:4Fe-4S binding protein [Elusimicrobiota bacterium]MBU2614419.1 4Fe-4S binding protein [Elusimicrobiota bacterium]
MMKRILLDIEICYKCRTDGKECSALCSYFYHHTEGLLKEEIINNGVEKLFAKAAQYLVCRRCEEKFCVNSCPQEALDKDEKGILQRYMMKCTSCKTCSIACPFGTIYPEILPYKSSGCDYCAGRANGEPPLCVETCPSKALQYIEVEESREKNIFVINDYFAVKGLSWNKDAKAGVP